MPRVSKLALATLAFVVFYLGSAPAARADPVVLVLTDPIQSGTPLTRLTFSGTYFNPGTEPFTVTDAAIVLEGSPDIFVDLRRESGLLQTVAAGALTPNAPLFSFLISSTAPPGTFTYLFVVNGNNPGGPTESSNFVPFTVTVLPGPAPVPEPATLILLGTGLAGIAARVRRRRDKVDE
jgi:hypothetical protein